MLELNNLFNICVLNDLYVFHTLRNADIVLICVYMYNIYIQCFYCCSELFFTVLFYIVTLTIIFIYYQFYLLDTNKDYYY